jgi:hypothetical protein
MRVTKRDAGKFAALNPSFRNPEDGPFNETCIYYVNESGNAHYVQRRTLPSVYVWPRRRPRNDSKSGIKYEVTGVKDPARVIEEGERVLFQLTEPRDDKCYRFLRRMGRRLGEIDVFLDDLPAHSTRDDVDRFLKDLQEIRNMAGYSESRNASLGRIAQRIRFYHLLSDMGHRVFGIKDKDDAIDGFIMDAMSEVFREMHKNGVSSEGRDMLMRLAGAFKAYPETMQSFVEDALKSQQGGSVDPSFVDVFMRNSARHSVIEDAKDIDNIDAQFEKGRAGCCIKRHVPNYDYVGFNRTRGITRINISHPELSGRSMWIGCLPDRKIDYNKLYEITPYVTNDENITGEALEIIFAGTLGIFAGVSVGQETGFVGGDILRLLSAELLGCMTGIGLAKLNKVYGLTKGLTKPLGIEDVFNSIKYFINDSISGRQPPARILDD